MIISFEFIGVGWDNGIKLYLKDNHGYCHPVEVEKCNVWSSIGHRRNALFGDFSFANFNWKLLITEYEYINDLYSDFNSDFSIEFSEKMETSTIFDFHNSIIKQIDMNYVMFIDGPFKADNVYFSGYEIGIRDLIDNTFDDLSSLEEFWYAHHRGTSLPEHYKSAYDEWWEKQEDDTKLSEDPQRFIDECCALDDYLREKEEREENEKKFKLFNPALLKLGYINCYLPFPYSEKPRTVSILTLEDVCFDGLTYKFVKCDQSILIYLKNFNESIQKRIESIYETKAEILYSNGGYALLGLVNPKEPEKIDTGDDDLPF